MEQMASQRKLSGVGSIVVDGDVNVDDDKFIITSFDVAKFFDRSHCVVEAAIEKLKVTGKFRKENFKKEYRYTPSLVRPGKMFCTTYWCMTREGFVALVNTFRSKKAKEWQAEFVSSYADFLRSKECPVSEVAPMPALYEGEKAESGNAPDFDENRLEIEEHDGQMWINSWDVALAFGKEHRNVMRDIERIVRKTPDSHLLKFEQMVKLRDNPVTGGKTKSRAYRMTRDGFLLLAFGWRDEKSRKLLLEYMNVFNKMESKLREQAEEERQKLLTERKQIEASREALLAEKGSWDARYVKAVEKYRWARQEVIPAAAADMGYWMDDVSAEGLARLCQVYVSYFAFMEEIPLGMAHGFIRQKLRVDVGAKNFEKQPKHVIRDALNRIKRLMYMRWRVGKSATEEQRAFVRKMLNLNSAMPEENGNVMQGLQNDYGIDAERLANMDSHEAKKIGDLLFSRFMQSCARLHTVTKMRRNVEARLAQDDIIDITPGDKKNDDGSEGENLSDGEGRNVES